MAINLPQPQAISSKRMSALTRKLQDMGYNHREIFRRLGVTDHLLWKTEFLMVRLNRIVVEREKQAPNDAVDAAINLLLMNIPTPRKELEKWLGSEEVSALEDMRIIRMDGAMAHCDLTLSEFQGLFIASDTMWRSPPGPFPPGLVLNPIFDSYMFASTFGKRPGKRSLDLCTGSGALGLHASRASKEAIGVDLFDRPLEFARFNKALNGISNIEFIKGDMYADLQGRFDRIVSNPPYVPVDDSKPSENFYSGGISGDVLTLRILEGLEQYLEDDGYCHLLGYLVYSEQAGGAGTAVVPDLRRFQKAKESVYDVLLLTYETPFKDPTIAFELARFGNAVKVEFGPYLLHKRVKAGRDPWFLRAPAAGETFLRAGFTGETRPHLEVEKLFSTLETSQDPQQTLKSFGVEPVRA